MGRRKNPDELSPATIRDRKAWAKRSKRAEQAQAEDREWRRQHPTPPDPDAVKHYHELMKYLGEE